LAPALAWSQVAELETVLLKPNSQVPVANTWYIDEAGNFVLMSEAQRHSYELAQLQITEPFQAVSEAASMQIPPDMLQQVMAYSAVMGGVAGGALVGGLSVTSGMLRGPEGPQGPKGETGLSKGNSPATIEVVDGSISVGLEMDRPNNSLRYILRDSDGINLDTFTANVDTLLFMSGQLGTEYAFTDIPNVEIDVSEADESDGLAGAYSKIEFEVSAGVDDYVNWSLYISKLWLPIRDAKGYAEFVALPIEFEAEASLSVTATDIVFTQSDQTITFEGLGGAGGSTDPLDYFM